MTGRKGTWPASVLCTAFLVLLLCMPAPAGVVYEPELFPEGVLRTQTMGMTSTQRLAWYLEQTNQIPDASVKQAQEEINGEIAGFLSVGGSTPQLVTQGADNDYYLTHNAWRGEDVNGAVFLDARCSYFPQDDQIILHGHNMKGGAVFGFLNEYRALDYLQSHPLITFTTLEGEAVYAIWAVADVNVDPEADNYFPEICWSFDPDSFSDYTGFLLEHSYFNIPVELSYGDRLLMLSTCSYVYSDSRLVICARRLREGEDAQTLAMQAAAAQESGTPLDDTVYVYSGGGDYESLIIE